MYNNYTERVLTGDRTTGKLHLGHGVSGQACPRDRNAPRGEPGRSDSHRVTIDVIARRRGPLDADDAARRARRDCKRR